MTSDNDLRRKLSMPQPPAEIKGKLLSNFHAQVEKQSRSSFLPLLVACTVAGIFVAGFLLVNYHRTPEIITFAISDIQNDHANGAGVILPLEKVYRLFNIKPPVQFPPVKISKYCNINTSKTVHMEIAHELGTVHLFIQHGQFKIPAWRANHGKVGRLNWRLFSKNNGVSILALTSHSVSSSALDQLIQNVFS